MPSDQDTLTIPSPRPSTKPGPVHSSGLVGPSQIAAFGHAANIVCLLRVATADRAVDFVLLRDDGLTVDPGPVKHLFICCTVGQRQPQPLGKPLGLGISSALLLARYETKYFITQSKVLSSAMRNLAKCHSLDIVDD
jgi:hypothetical protein